jgi:hypothetical protein
MMTLRASRRGVRGLDSNHQWACIDCSFINDKTTRALKIEKKPEQLQFTPLNPNIATRKAFTDNLTQAPIPRDASPEWKWHVEKLQSIITSSRITKPWRQICSKRT